MTTTYDLTTIIGKVRLIIGDTDVSPASDAVFTDAELEFFLSEQSDDINLASAQALEAWAAKYMANVEEEKIGDYSYTQAIVDNMLKVAKQLREKAISIPAGDAAEIAHTDFSYRQIIHNRHLRTG